MPSTICSQKQSQRKKLAAEKKSALEMIRKMRESSFVVTKGKHTKDAKQLRKWVSGEILAIHRKYAAKVTGKATKDELSHMIVELKAEQRRFKVKFQTAEHMFLHAVQGKKPPKQCFTRVKAKPAKSKKKHPSKAMSRTRRATKAMSDEDMARLKVSRGRRARLRKQFMDDADNSDDEYTKARDDHQKPGSGAAYSQQAEKMRQRQIAARYKAEYGHTDDYDPDL